MKVLHIETGMHLYGGGRQVVWLMHGLAERGVDNLLVCPAGSAIAREDFPAGVRVDEVPMHGDIDLAFIGRVSRRIQRYAPDLVHLHSRRGADWLGAIAARRRGCPVVLSRRVTNPEHRWLAPIKYRLYDRVITISRAIAAELERAGVPAEKIRVVHSAAPPARFPVWERSRFLQEFGLSEGARVVGMAAQFIRRKGHADLLAALPEVLQERPDVHVLLFGQGPLEDSIVQEIHDRGMAPRVQAVGFRADLDAFLSHIEILVHPALDEGLGVILLQASAAGVPVVSTSVGGIPEIIRDGKNGVLVPPGDSPALAAALAWLLDDSGLHDQMSRTGPGIVADEFSLEAMVDGNLSVYRDLIGSTHHAHSSG
ncbi:MAG: glycosyltransferase family 4 protein [Gammaproteobacteria bacterium]